MQTEELDQIQNMELNEFTTMLKMKLETIINAPESPENSVTGPEKKGSITSNGEEQSNKKSKETDQNDTPRKSSRISKKGPGEMNLMTKIDNLYAVNLKEAH